MSAPAIRRLRRIRVGLFVFLFGALAYFMPGASWGPVSRFSLTRAIVEKHTLEITRFAASTGDRARVGDRYFTDKAPVPSLLAVPAYAVYYSWTKANGRFPAFRAEGTEERPAKRVIVSPAFRKGLYVCSLSTAGLAVAALGVLLFEALRRRTTEVVAVVGAVLAVLGTPLFTYGVSFFGHAIAAAFLVAAFVAADPLAKRGGWRGPVLAGMCLGLAVGCEYIVVLPAALLGGHLVFAAPPARRARVAALLGAGAALPLAVVGAYHAACFGSPFRTGYSYVTHPDFAPGHAQGFLGITFPKLDALYGILFGSARGIFYVSPVVLVGLVAGHVLYRKTRDRDLAVAALAFAILVLVNASYYRWDGGLSIGPRHVVPALGLVGLLIARSFEVPRVRTAAAVAAGYSCLVMVLAAAVGVEAPPEKNVVFDYLLPALDRGEVARISGASNLGIELGLSRPKSLLPIIAWLVLGALLLRRYAARFTPDQKPAREPEHPEGNE